MAEPVQDVEGIAARLTSLQLDAVRRLPEHGTHPYRLGVDWGTAKALAARGLGQTFQLSRFFAPNEMFSTLRAHLLSQDSSNDK